MSARNIDLTRETLVSLTGQIGTAGVGFIQLYIIARALGPSGLGEYYFALTAALIASRGPIGVSHALRKRVSEDTTKHHAYFGVGLLTTTLYALALGLISLIAITFFSPGAYVTQLSALGVGLVFTITTFDVVQDVYAARGNPGYSMCADAIRSTTTLAFQLLALWLGAGVVGLLACYVLSTFLAATGLTVVGRLRPAWPTPRVVQRVRSFATWSVPNAFVTELYSKYDVLVLGLIASSAAVGVYEASLRLVLPVTFVAASAGGALDVRASNRASRGLEISDDLQSLLNYVGVLAIPTLAGSALLGEAIMTTVYGGEFAGTGYVLAGVAAFHVFRVYARPFLASLKALDRPDAVFKIQGIGLLVNLPLSVMLAMSHGVSGVIAATLVVEMGILAGYAWATSSHVAIKPPLRIGRQVVAAVGMAIGIVGLRSVIPITNWVSLLVVVGGAGIIYVTELATFHWGFPSRWRAL